MPYGTSETNSTNSILSNPSTEPMVIKVDIHPGPDTPRHDNKELDPEKAEEIVEHMTEEQKEKLREVMK